MIATGSYDPKAFRATGERPYPFLGPGKLFGFGMAETVLAARLKKSTALRFLIENGYSSRIGGLRFLM
jgi:hypothetical protein